MTVSDVQVRSLLPFTAFRLQPETHFYFEHNHILHPSSSARYASRQATSSRSLLSVPCPQRQS